MTKNIKLTDIIRSIKNRSLMYLSEKSVTSIYDFLLGWDCAKNTNILTNYISKIAKIKNTGSRCPAYKDIPFDEAIEELLLVITNDE